MATAKEVFKALPHVQEVWITEDGHHHLHDANGGKKITREDIKEKSAPEKKEADKK